MTVGAEDWQTEQWKVGSNIDFPQQFPTGRVIFQDNFGSPNTGFSDVNGKGTFVIYSINFYSRPSCLFLQTESNATDTTKINRYFGTSATGKVGLEFVFTADLSPGNIGAEFKTNDGTLTKQGGIRYDGQNNVWQYLSAVDTWTNIPNGDIRISTDNDFWHRFKFTIDFANNKYMRLYINGDSIDLSDLPTVTAGSGAARVSEFRLFCKSANIGKDSFFVDNLILTEE